jgi:proteasome lid subunit RPN8/RPN11
MNSSQQQPEQNPPPRAFSNHTAATAVHIDAGAEGLLRQDAAEAYPEEACGFLFGKTDANQVIIEEAIMVRNQAGENRERRFAIRPEDYRAAERYADQNGLNLVGIYHSHPDHPAEPSEHDRRQALPGLSYLIVSVRQGRPRELRSWTLNADRLFDEEAFRAVATAVAN